MGNKRPVVQRFVSICLSICQNRVFSYVGDKNTLTGCSILHPQRPVNSFLFFSNFHKVKQQNHENYARFTVPPPVNVAVFIKMIPGGYYTSIVKRSASSSAAAISSPKRGFQGRCAASQRSRSKKRRRRRSSASNKLRSNRDSCCSG